jgi:hypothetical protein
MNTLGTKLAESTDWRDELYFLIKEILKFVYENNKFDKRDLDKNLKDIHKNSMQVISDSRGKYLILRKEKLKTTKGKLHALLNKDESYYELNKEVTSPMLISLFIYPLIKKTKSDKRVNQMTGKKISEKKLSVLNKIRLKQKELEKKYGRRQTASMNNAIQETYKELTKNEKHTLLHIDEDIDIPDSLTNKQIHSINSTIYYHKNNPQK